MANKAVFDVEPGNRGSVRGRAEHNTRERMPKNADPDKAAENIVLVGPSSAAEIAAAVHARIDEAKTRKLSAGSRVIAEEVHGVSSEYFRPGRPGEAGAYDKDRLDAWAGALKKDLTERYGNQLVSLIVHLDEAAPHAHAIIVPLSPKNKISYNHHYGSPAKLRELRTSLAKSLEPLGIVRGQAALPRPEKADLDQYYARANAAVSLDRAIDEARADPKPLPNYKLWTRDKAEKAVRLARAEEQARIKPLQVALAKASEQIAKVWGEAQKHYAPILAENKGLWEDKAELHKQLIALEKAVEQAEDVGRKQGLEHVAKYSLALDEAKEQLNQTRAELKKAVATANEAQSKLKQSEKNIYLISKAHVDRQPGLTDNLRKIVREYERELERTQTRGVTR